MDSIIGIDLVWKYQDYALLYQFRHYGQTLGIYHQKLGGKKNVFRALLKHSTVNNTLTNGCKQFGSTK